MAPCNWQKEYFPSDNGWSFFEYTANNKVYSNEVTRYYLINTNCPKTVAKAYLTLTH